MAVKLKDVGILGKRRHLVYVGGEGKFGCAPVGEGRALMCF
jgi:hypothetical protein